MSSAQDPFYIVREEIQDSRLEIRALDDLLSLPPSDATATEAEWHCGKRQRIGGGNQQVPALAGALMNEFVLPPPQPPPVPVPTQVPEHLAFVRGADTNKKAAGGGGGGACQAVQNSAARQRRIRKRISEKTAELARLIPGARKLSSAEMLEEAARHVRLLMQAQVGMLALMRAAAGSSEFMQEEKMPSAMAQEGMHALLVCGSVLERLAAEGKCLVPWNLVDAVAKDDAVNASAVVRKGLGRFVASLHCP